MADTGAPWNLPYPLPTDLVRDGAQAIEDLAEATATGLSLAGNEGIGPNVVSVHKTDGFTTTSSTFVTIDDLEVTITPSSNSSKILVIAHIHYSYPVEGGAVFRLRRGTTDLGNPTAGAENGMFASVPFRATNSEQFMQNVALVFLDSPETDTAITYDIQTKGSGTGLRVNNSAGSFQMNGTSSLTVIEVAA